MFKAYLVHSNRKYKLKNYLAVVIFIFCAEAFSYNLNIKSQSQDLNFISKEFTEIKSYLSVINRQFKVNPDGFVVIDNFYIYFQGIPSGTNSKSSVLKVKVLNETFLTPQFKWKSTRLIEDSSFTKTSEFIVNGKEVFVNVKVDKKPARSKKITYKDDTLPLNALPYFLFNQGRKKIGIPNDLDIFYEPEQSFKKISWVYLGTSLENKKKIHRFEIKGGLSQIIQMDTDGRIVKIKDLKNFYELTSVR